MLVQFVYFGMNFDNLDNLSSIA